MSNRRLDHSRSSATSTSPNLSSKLPKFLQKHTFKSRSPTSPVDSSSSSSTTPSLDSRLPLRIPRKTTKLTLGSKKSSSSINTQLDEPPEVIHLCHPNASPDTPTDETPVIVEPVPIPRTRTRSERPQSAILTSEGLMQPSSSSSSLLHTSASYTSGSTKVSLGDLPTRLSGWFAHAFSSSATDLPSVIAQSHLSPTSPTSRAPKPNPLLTVAKQGKGHLDKAFRYILDTDATPDKSTEPIWLLGVQHPGYEPPPPAPQPISRRGSVDSRRTPSFRSSSSGSSHAAEPPQLPSAPSHPPVSFSMPHPLSPSAPKNALGWPSAFYADFTSRVWLTYRSQFTPIRDVSLAALVDGAWATVEASLATPTASPQQMASKRWIWSGGSVGEKTWTSDAGWGCMLRTGQSLLANALMHLHLGREWSHPPNNVYTADFARYVQILTWFFDTPSPLAPFSVHRMALAGKELGTEVGQWFGPSIAAGAIRTLTQAFPEAGIGVSIASDGVIFQSEVFAASTPDGGPSASWGGRAVLVLIGIRLGLDGVNPIYYDSVKTLYTFPQSVGIAGGRPSSSYYFVGSQGDGLFYLDPHHPRLAIPLRPPPPTPTRRGRRSPAVETGSDHEQDPDHRNGHRRASPSQPVPSPRSPSSIRSSATGSSTFSHHTPVSPSPLQHQISTGSGLHEAARPGVYTRRQQARTASSSRVQTPVSPSEAERLLDELQTHYASAYSPVELKTFHCDRVRKLPLSGLDPSMLIAFLCRDEQSWIDFRARVNDLAVNYKPIFTIQDEPPNWPSGSDDDLGFESISEQEDTDSHAETDEFEDAKKKQRGGDRGEEDEFYETPSPDGSVKEDRKSSLDLETEEDSDPMRPVTPGETSYDGEQGTHQSASSNDLSQEERSSIVGDDDDNGDDDDGWVDPSKSPSSALVHLSSSPASSEGAQQIAKSKSGNGDSGVRKKSSKARSKKKTLVLPSSSPQSYPFPRSTEDMPPSPSQPQMPESNGRSEKPKRMHTARARDGGRTQSGGVKGVID